MKNFQSLIDLDISFNLISNYDTNENENEDAIGNLNDDYENVNETLQDDNDMSNGENEDTNDNFNDDDVDNNN